MTTKKKTAKVVSLSDEGKCRRAYNIPATHQLNEDELIEWLIKIATDSKGKYVCDWIGVELVRRFAATRKQLARQQKTYDELWNTHFKDLERLEGELLEARRLYAEKVDHCAHAVAELETTIENHVAANTADKRTITQLEEQITSLQNRIAEKEEPCNSSVDTAAS